MMKGGIPKINDKSVGIIGAGSAGLSAAHDLALLKAKVSIYEMEQDLAGMLAYGVPSTGCPGILSRLR